MLDTLKQETGNYLIGLYQMKENEEVTHLLLKFNNEPFNLETEELPKESNPMDLTTEFYVVCVGTINKESFFEKESDEETDSFELDEEKAGKLSFLTTSLLNTKIVDFSMDGVILTLENEDGKKLDINIATYKYKEDTEDIRVIRGFNVSTMKEVSFADIQPLGNGMMHKMMNAIVSNKVSFKNIVLDEDLFEGDIIEVHYQKNSSFDKGMLLYDYKRQEYILKNKDKIIYLESNPKPIKSVKFIMTFLEMQTKVMYKPVLFDYMNHGECEILMEHLTNANAVVLGRNSILSLVLNDTYEVNNYIDNLFSLGIPSEVKESYFNDLIRNHPIRIDSRMPYIAFIN